MLAELLQRWADEAPGRACVIAAGPVLTYEGAARRARSAARGLARSGPARFGCLLRAPEDAVVVLAAAAAAGSEPCLYRPGLDAVELERLASRLGHEAVLVDDDAPATRLRTLTPATLEEAGSAPPGPVAGAAPILVLTTGTTGEPKAARHDWGSLLPATPVGPEERGRRWLSAYDLNQFAGLQVLAHVLATAGTLVVPRSRRAGEVLEAIREQAVTHVSGTPTFWRAIAAHAEGRPEGDRPRLRQVTLGGEAAPQDLIDRLVSLFPEARVSHVYAGTEFGAVVTVHDGRSGLPASVLDRSAGARAQLRVVEDELQVRSHVGMRGYHAADDDDGDWRGTGDLVRVGADRIEFVGRITEMINVGGAKVHPLPVEDLIRGIRGVRVAAVYGVPNPVTGEVVAADVVALPGTDETALRAQIRETCRGLPATSRPRRIRFVPELATRGSKVLRRAASEGP